MSKKPAVPRFRYGDRVKIKYLPLHGLVEELRGPLAPGGILVYRVRLRRKSQPTHIEVTEDQIDLAPVKAKPKNPVPQPE